MIDLDAIRQRADAATEGEWIAVSESIWFYRIDTETRTALATLGQSYAEKTLPDGSTVSQGLSGNSIRANADFIAHAREDIPALISEVERLREENEDLRNESQ